MGKNARVDGRRLAYDQMKAECRQGLLLGNCLGRTRQHVSDDDLLSFKTAIDKNNTSYFGLAKLRKLDVDVLFEEGNHKSTLLQYASKQNRDKIVINLLRANANPLIRTKNNLFTSHSLEPEQRQQFLKKIGCFLSSLNLRYLTYILHQVVGIRKNGRDRFAGSLDGTTKFTCSGCKNICEPDDACILNDCERHVICEYCLWQRLLKSNPMNDIEPLSVCPLCDHDKGGSILRSIDAMTNDICSKKLFSTSIEESKRSFYRLPADKLSLKENIAIRKSKQNTNKGMQKSTLRKLLIGETQKKRSEMYFEAIDTGNFLRLLHILNRGIDIDIVDENGESGLLKAAFHLPRELVEAVLENNQGRLFSAISLLLANVIDIGEVHQKLNFLYTLQVLLAFGANCDIRSNFGIRTMDCASMLDMKLSQTTMQQMLYNGAEEIDISAVVSDLHGTSSCNISLPSNHPAKNLSFIIDKAFSEVFLSRLVDLYESMPLENQDRRDQEKKRYSDTCARRKFFRERGAMWISRTIEYVLAQLKSSSVERNLNLPRHESKLPCCCFPRMRFLNYQKPGGMMKPHVDLSKSHLFRKEEALMLSCDRQSMVVESTFTFILYLTDCSDGGETVFLRRLGDKKSSRDPKIGVDEDSSNIISRVSPKRGRLLIFPHEAPHAGAPVGREVPKLFLRGELC